MPIKQIQALKSFDTFIEKSLQEQNNYLSRTIAYYTRAKHNYDLGKFLGQLNRLQGSF